MSYTVKEVNSFSHRVGEFFKVMIWSEDGVMLGEAMRKPFGRRAYWAGDPRSKWFPIKLDKDEGLWIKA